MLEASLRYQDTKRVSVYSCPCHFGNQLVLYRYSLVIWRAVMTRTLSRCSWRVRDYVRDYVRGSPEINFTDLENMY